MSEELAAKNAALETLLRDTLDVDDYLDFDALKELPEVPHGFLSWAGQGSNLRPWD